MKSSALSAIASRPWRPRHLVFALAILAPAALLLPSFKSPPASRSMMEIREIAGVPNARHQLALTFDAGGDCTGLPELLAALDKAKVHSTFFITSLWAARHSELVEEIHRRGHEIGNHSWSHPDLTRLTLIAVRSEIEQADSLLAKLSGQSPRPLFRAPYGARDTRVLETIHQQGYLSVYWSLDSLDSDEPPKSPDFLVARVCNRTDAELNGAIILMHVGEPATAAALPTILAGFKARGLKNVPVSTLLKSL